MFIFFSQRFLAFCSLSWKSYFVKLVWQFSGSLQCLESLNLNGCQKITDAGVEAVAYACPKLKAFSIYWNVRCFSSSLTLVVEGSMILLPEVAFYLLRITDTSVKHLVKFCKDITCLNLSGCKVRYLICDIEFPLLIDGFHVILSNWHERQIIYQGVMWGFWGIRFVL